tara:strand:+ start:11357 stop:11848 length:492 start_codon:yes stop_codon:yes gene_type:complete
MKRARNACVEDGPPPKALALEAPVNKESLENLLRAVKGAFDHAIVTYSGTLWHKERELLNTMSIALHSGEAMAVTPMETDFGLAEALTSGIVAQLRSNDTKRHLRKALLEYGYVLLEDSEHFITFFNYSWYKGSPKSLQFFTDPTETFYALIDKHVSHHVNKI